VIVCVLSIIFLLRNINRKSSCPVWNKKRQEKPQLSETDVMLKELFESHGFSDTLTNRAKVDRYRKDHGLTDYSLETIGHAIDTVAEHLGLEPSDEAIAKMSSHAYRKIVEREFKE